MWQIFVTFAGNKIASTMKKTVILILLTLLVPFADAAAQKIILGERVPELKVGAWLGGQLPQAAPMTYVEFFHSSNPACIASMDKLKEYTNKLGTKLRVVVLTQEKEEKISSLLQPYLSPQISVGLDTDGRIFTAFGVNYVPFGVLLDAKNRSLWMGNTLQLTPRIIEQSTK